MGDIADKLEYLYDTKEKIADAIESMGTPVSKSDTFRSYATKISSLKDRATVDLDNLSEAGLNVIRTNGGGGGSINVPIATPEQAGIVAPDDWTIKINDSGVISAKLPTKISELENDSRYQTDTDISNLCYTKNEINDKLSEVAHYRGWADSVIYLPTDAENGDIYYCNAEKAHYIFNGNEWDKLSGNSGPTIDSYTKEEIDSKFNDFEETINQREFVQHEDLEEYALLEDIANFCTIDEVEEKINETLSSIDLDLTGYATTEEVENALKLKADSSDVYTREEIDGMLENIELPTDVVTLSDLESMGYITQNDIIDKADKADSLEGYGIQNAYTKDEINELIPEVPTNISAFENDSNYITLQDVDGKADKDDTYTKTEVDDIVLNAVTEGRVDLTGYATTEEVNNQLLLKEDKGVCYTKSELDGKLAGAFHYKGNVENEQALPEQAEQGDVYNVLDTGANYAYTGSEWDKLSEVIDLSGVYTKEECDNKFTTLTEVNEQGFLIESDLSDYAKSSDIPTDFYTKQEVDNKFTEFNPDLSSCYTKEQTDSLLANKANTSDIPDTSSFATTSELGNKQDKLTSGTGISIQNNVIACTVQQPDLSNYYTKSEIDGMIGNINEILDYILGV